MEIVQVYNEADNTRLLRTIYRRYRDGELGLIFGYCVRSYISCDLCDESIVSPPYFTIDGEHERHDDSFDICIDCMIKLLPALHDIICSGSQCQIKSRVTTRHRNLDYIPVYDQFTDETWKSPINRQVLIDKLCDQFYDVDITDCELAIVQAHGPGCTICMHDYPVLVKVDMERPDMPGKEVPFTLNSKPTPGEREFLGTPVPLAWDCNPMPTVYICPVCINRLPYPEDD